MAISKTAGVFVKEGKTLDFTATADVKCGDIKVINGCNCLALWDIPNGAKGSLKILAKGEVIKLTTDEAIGATNAGVAIYVTSAGLATKTAESNTLLGYTVAAVGATDLSFEIVCA